MAWHPERSGIGHLSYKYNSIGDRNSSGTFSSESKDGDVLLTTLTGIASICASSIAAYTCRSRYREYSAYSRVKSRDVYLGTITSGIFRGPDDGEFARREEQVAFGVYSSLSQRCSEHCRGACSSSDKQGKDEFLERQEGHPF